MFASEKDEAMSEIRRAHACRMCVCVCVCVYRVSEGSTLCPEWKDLHFPQHGDSFNSLGAPKFLSIDYYQWKARPASEVGIAHTQYLHGNPREPEYCSVTAMMQWYMCQHMVEGRIIELRKGPIFGNFNPAKPKALAGYLKEAREQKTMKMGSGTNKCKVWYNHRELRQGKEEGSDKEEDYVYTDRVNFTEDGLRKLLYDIFDVAADVAASKSMCQSETRLRAATCHTLRATCVAWAARSKSPNAFIEAKLAGRWVDTSKVFRIYWSLGAKVNEAMYGDRNDVIHTFKPWPVGGTTRRPDSSVIQRSSALLYEGRGGLWEGGASGGERVRARGTATAAETARREAAARRLRDGYEQ